MCLGKVYCDRKHPSSFRSVAKSLKASKCKKRDVEEWLPGQKIYTLHKPVRKRFPRNLNTETNIDGVWQIDVVDLSSFAKYNDKYKYLFISIDIFLRYA